MSKQRSKPIPTKTNILVVEGQDDLHSLANLLKYHLQVEHVEESINIKQLEGYTKLHDKLPELLRATDLERFGIIVDADTDIEARWQSIRDKLLELKPLGFQFADIKLNPNGTIFTADYLGRTLTIGVWIMPNNQQNGMLEDFLMALIANNDTLWTRAKHCIEQIPPADRHFQPIHQSKAELHTWLAWQKEPGKPFGQAIDAKWLNPTAPHAQTLMQWLRQLFNL